MSMPTRTATPAQSGILRRYQPARPNLPSEVRPAPRQRQATREHTPTSGRSARLRAAFAAWQEARRDRPVPPPSNPRSRRRGVRWFLVQLGLAILLGLLALHIVSHQPGGASQRPAPVQQATAPAPSPPSTGAARGTPPSTVEPQPPAVVVATFLSAYFSWKATDPDTAYAQHWLPYVAPDARRDLLMAAPRLALDKGADSAANSPAPAVAQAARPGEPTQVAWTIQVLPPGGEQVTWQPRHIQASLTLIQTSSGWQVVSMTWTSSPTGGTA